MCGNLFLNGRAYYLSQLLQQKNYVDENSHLDEKLLMLKYHIVHSLVAQAFRG